MFLSIKHAAKELRVSERHIRRLIAIKKLPVYQLSPRTTRIDMEELRKLIRIDQSGPAEVTPKKPENE